MVPDSRAQQRTTDQPVLGLGAYLMLGFIAVSAIITVVAPGEIADVVGVLAVFTGSLVTGVLFVRNAQSLGGREGLAWTLIGAGMLLAAIGVLAVAIVFAIVGDAPAFGLTDLFFFGTYVLMLAGFAALPHTQGSPHQRSRMILDGLIGAVSIGALLWVFLISDAVHDLEGLSVVNRTIGIIYPFLDLLVFTVATLVLIRRSVYRFDVRLALFTVGVTAQVIGDVAFLTSSQAGSFDEAQPLFIANLFGLAAFFTTAYILRSPAAVREYADRNPPLWTVVAPYIPAVGMLAVFLIITYRTSAENVNGVLLGSTVLVSLMVIARQGVAIVENRSYIEQQRNALVSTISHELRTPLTAVLGFVDILEQDDESIGDTERRGMLQIVQRQAEYMSRIVSDLIMLARGSDGDVQLEIEPVAMQPLVQASIEASGVTAESVAVDCPPTLIGYVDPARIQQVLVNLLTNAARYGGKDRLLRVAADGSDLLCEVHDDGAGVPRRFEVRIWERFERGPNRLNSNIPGSGIGLAIVEAIAEAHGGVAAYRQSDELGGACFSVSLPGRAAYVAAPATEVQSSAAIPIRPVA